MILFKTEFFENFNIREGKIELIIQSNPWQHNYAKVKRHKKKNAKHSFGLPLMKVFVDHN